MPHWRSLGLLFALGLLGVLVSTDEDDRGRKIPVREPTEAADPPEQ